MCVAGIDPATGRHIRPVLASQMRVEMLACHGGPFDLARIVDLGETRFVGKIPEIEDQLFDAKVTRVEGTVPADEFRRLLEAAAREDLAEIFGPDLVPRGNTFGILERRGLRSLGCFWAPEPRLFIETLPTGRRRVRFSFRTDSSSGSTGARSHNVPVTDIRLYAEDHVTPSSEQVDAVSSQLRRLARLLVSIGLSRAYRRTADEPAIHWLQINNIHLPQPT